MLRTLSFVAAAAATLALASPAAAAEMQTESRTVTYADLNLQTEHGAETALRRIRTAAHEVCRGVVPYSSVTYTAAMRHCVRQVTDDAVARLDARMVTAAHVARGGAAPTHGIVLAGSR